MSGVSYQLSQTPKSAVDEHGQGPLKYFCSLCGKHFKSASGYYMHVRLHQERGTVECKICKRVCETKKRLEMHMTSHNTVRQFKCLRCGRWYKYKWNLNKHSKICKG